jgi:hypothetical protein
MTSSLAFSASESQEAIAFISNAMWNALRQNRRVLNSIEILTELARRGIERKEIADALDIDAGGVTRLFYAIEKNPKGTPRKLTHDEAVILASKFQLERGPPPLPPAVWRIVARHIASKLALPLREDDPRLQDLVGDLAAFSRFVRNRQVQGLVEAADHFFDAMQSRRELEQADQTGTRPQPAS